jgi:hypothetical protein
MFFRKSGLRRTGTEFDILKDDIKELRNRVARLECPHHGIDLAVEEVLTFLPSSIYYGKKFCKSCGKTLEYYQDKASLLTARNKLMRELIALNEKEIKK